MDKITVLNKLRAALTESGWTDIFFPMSNGDMLTISPCGYAKNLNEDNVEYYLVFSPSTPNMGGDTLDIIAEQIANYEQHLQERAAEKAELRAFFDRRIAPGNPNPDDWSFYSDWHKDVYGYRPHGMVCGVYINPHTGVRA